MKSLGKGRRLWDGQRLKEIRDDRGISQDDLAAKAEVGKSDISRHETNGASNPTVENLGRIAIALDVPLWALLQPVGSAIPPRPGKDGKRAGSITTDDALADHLRRAADRIDADFPAEDSWKGDIYQAVAALTRALRRPDSAAEPGEPAKKTRR